MTAAGSPGAERHLPGMLLAGIRFLGQFDELPDRFARLRAMAQEALIGPALLLYWGRDPGGGFHLEVAYPVDEEVEGAGVESHVLPAYWGWCLRRHCPVDSPGAAFREALESAAEAGRDLTTYPPYVAAFLEERSELEPVETARDIEARVALLMPMWAAQLERGVERVAGPDARRRVLDRVPEAGRPAGR